MFDKKNFRTVRFEEFGNVAICYARNRDMGKCDFEDEFITPNMPKLLYAVKFNLSTKNGDFEPNIRGISDELKEKYTEGYVFEKHDGFNVLFYRYKGKIIPKTRLRPIAAGTIGKVLKLPEFPYNKIEKMVKEDLVPIFEVWGPRLSDFNIMFGMVDMEYLHCDTPLAIGVHGHPRKSDHD